MAMKADLCLERGVLNAFRHHRGRHEQALAEIAAIHECSTPFGITEVGTPDQTGLFWPGGTCSTPFGITEVGTAERGEAMTAKEACSTPFGITEVGTA